MKKNDKYGKEVEIGDWVVYSVYNSMQTGVVASFTQKGNPRVFVYDEGYREYNEIQIPFRERPIAVGVNSGFIKIAPLAEETPLR